MATHQPGQPLPPLAATEQPTGRQRASRIPLDYFKRTDPLEKWRLWLSGLALLVIVVGGVGWSLAGGNQVRETYSRGPVASVHAAWDHECAACHVDFGGMTKSNWNPLMSLLSGSTRAKLASDTRCESCHAGPVHHRSQKDESTPSCGGCHRDHQGRNFSLVRLADTDCTSCHANLKDNMKEPDKLAYENKVTRFTGDHPEFRILKDGKKDPGKLKFNHKLHMTPGQVATAGGQGAWTLGRIKAQDPTAYERYRAATSQEDKSDTAPVKLDCCACHVLDAGDHGITAKNKPPGVSSAALMPRAPGAYMLPISYDLQCKACHPLTFDAKVKGPDDRVLGVPHRLEPAEVSDFLWGAYAGQYLKDHPDLDKRLKDLLSRVPGAYAPLPGKSNSLSKEEAEARASIDKDVREAALFLFKDSVTRAESYLLRGKTSCGECHSYETAADGKPTKIVPPAVPMVWFEHARFNHASHRAVDCRSCHANAYALEADGKENPNASQRHADVLLPGIDNCRQCHAPAAGVRHDCNECHNYHHGDRPLQGLGAMARDPKRTVDIQRFLKGAHD